MAHSHPLYIILCCLTAIVCGCSRQKSQVTGSEQYAQGFHIEQLSNGVRIVVYDAQDKETVQTDIIVPSDAPFHHIGATSATHVGMLHELGADSLIAGICDMMYIYNEEPQAADLGSAFQLDPERILAAGVDVLVLSYSTDQQCLDMLRRMGITVVYNNEWTEQHPLARAEWIRLMGALTGRLHQADSIFEQVKNDYEHLAAEPIEGVQRSIMSGSAWQGTWYVPAGNTYMGRLFADGGAEYTYSSDSSAQSIPLTFEQAVLAFGDADVWVGAPTETMDELCKMNDKHAWFNAYKTGNVYNFNRRTRGAANDFWESGVVHPERILQDLRIIMQGGNDSLLYYSAHLQ